MGEIDGWTPAAACHGAGQPLIRTWITLVTFVDTYHDFGTHARPSKFNAAGAAWPSIFLAAPELGRTGEQ